MTNGTTVVHLRRTRVACGFAVGLLLVGLACTTNSQDNSGNALLTEALSYDGKITGQVFESQSTRTSLDDGAAAQTAPPGFNTANTVVRFQDMRGRNLNDPDGNPIPPAPLNEDGTFTADNLPVGTDFTVCVDIEADQSCDEISCVNIPGDPVTKGGDLEGARVDPLTTMILAKLTDLLNERGIDWRDLPVSPVAVVNRIVEAYIHLYEESGINQTLTREDIAGITLDELADLFDEVVPALAQSGMRIVEGNLDLARAQNAQDRALAAAEVFLRAGFPIADEPGGLDLSHFADLDGVESALREDLFGSGPPLGDFKDNVEDDFSDEFDALGPAEDTDPTIIYFDTTAEPDRNFSNAEDEDSGDTEGIPHLPVIADRVLLKMARVDVAGARLTLAALHDALTDLEDGLGARLTHDLHDPNFAGPPLTVFQTEDGKGKAIDLDQVFRRIFDGGLNRLGEDDLDRANVELQLALVELLGDTVPPDFDLLFGDITDDRIEGASDLARRIRNARVHLPFNRSGPEAFFVVADGDPFRSDAEVNAVTVDATVDPNGKIETVTYNANGEGEFYLGFTRGTEEDGSVEFIIRETGNRLHGPRGPVRLNMQDESVFADIDGEPFFAFVSEAGRFFPGVDVPAPRVRFFPPEPAPGPGDPDGEPDDGRGDLPPPPPPPTDSNGLPLDNDGDPSQDNPTGVSTNGSQDGDVPPGPAEFDDDVQDAPPDAGRLFVLATAFGPDAEPVRVDYDRETGDATYNPDGRNLLMFMPDSESTGLFRLFNEQTGREARVDDPEGFFEAPPERPDGFEDFYNEFDEDFDPNRDPDEFVDDFLDNLPQDPNGLPPGDPNDPNNPPPPPPDPNNPDGTPVDDPNNPPPPPPDDGGDDIAPAEFVDEDGFILIAAREVDGLEIDLQTFTHVFGTDAENERYDADADPYYDDVNDNDAQDDDEPTVAFRPTLFDPRDWRATDIPAYYRRADDGEAVEFDEVDFESDTPRTLDGVELVARNYKPRLNAFRFGRPNTAMNLLTAFSPPEFFDGTRTLEAATSVDIFTAVALVNLTMDQVFNLEAEVDIDGIGPLPRKRTLLDAHMFIVPLDDPFVVLVRTMADRAETSAPPSDL